MKRPAEGHVCDRVPGDFTALPLSKHAEFIAVGESFWYTVTLEEHTHARESDIVVDVRVISIS